MQRGLCQTPAEVSLPWLLVRPLPVVPEPDWSWSSSSWDAAAVLGLMHAPAVVGAVLDGLSIDYLDGRLSWCWSHVSPGLVAAARATWCPLICPSLLGMRLGLCCHGLEGCLQGNDVGIRFSCCCLQCDDLRVIRCLHCPFLALDDDLVSVLASLHEGLVRHGFPIINLTLECLDVKHELWVRTLLVSLEDVGQGVSGGCSPRGQLENEVLDVLIEQFNVVVACDHVLVQGAQLQSDLSLGVRCVNV